MPNKNKWSVITNCILTLALAWGGYQLMGLSGGKNDEPQNIIDYCQLSTKACEQNHAIVTLSNDVIHPMQSAEVSVSWPDIPKNTDNLILSLEGHEMMMGVYKLKLTRTLNGHFSGNLMLPFCTSEEMTWQGNIKPDSNSVKIEPINVSLRMIK